MISLCPHPHFASEAALGAAKCVDRSVGTPAHGFVHGFSLEPCGISHKAWAWAGRRGKERAMG